MEISFLHCMMLFSDVVEFVITCFQASVYSLLQAAIEISSRGDERDNDINVFTQRR